MRNWRAIAQHTPPNAMTPIINVIALNLVYLIVAVVLVEASDTACQFSFVLREDTGQVPRPSGRL